MYTCIYAYSEFIVTAIISEQTNDFRLYELMKDMCIFQGTLKPRKTELLQFSVPFSKMMMMWLLVKCSCRFVEG